MKVSPIDLVTTKDEIAAIISKNDNVPREDLEGYVEAVFDLVQAGHAIMGHDGKVQLTEKGRKDTLAKHQEIVKAIENDDELSPEQDNIVMGFMATAVDISDDLIGLALDQSNGDSGLVFAAFITAVATVAHNMDFSNDKLVEAVEAAYRLNDLKAGQ